MATRKALIAGSGLGGLQCAFILARNGYDVTVLEQGSQTGGCLQSYRRKGQIFDTGFHYVGGLQKGGTLEWLFTYFGLMDLPWQQLDCSCVDEIMIGDKTYMFASGYDNFVESLGRYFPAQKDGISKLIDTIRDIRYHTAEKILEGTIPEAFGINAYQFISTLVTDKELFQVLAGAAMRLHVDADRLSLYEYAQIYGSFIESGWKLPGGGQQIADHLVSDILRMGGKIITDCRISSFKTIDGCITAAVSSEGRLFESDLFISDIHPAVTLNLLDNPKVVRKVYRDRIMSLDNSYGIFTISARLKPGAVKYVNHIIHLHSDNTDLWHPVPGTMESFMISFTQSGDTGFAEGVDILTPVSYLSFGDNPGHHGHRSECYTMLKDEMARRCLNAVSKKFPALIAAVEDYYTSTPNTYEDYTSTVKGSAFGVMKDSRDPLFSIISPRTPIRNLFLTGQNLSLHGVLGVSLSALASCREILGKDIIKKEFNIR